MMASQHRSIFYFRFLFQIFLLLPFATGHTYDEDYALNALHYAYAAYCKDSSLSQWNCKWCSHSHLDTSSHGAGVVTTDDQSLQAFMGYDSNEQQVVLSFRGTVMMSFQDWIDDLEMVRTPYPFYKNGSGGTVHYGFHKAWTELENAGLTTMIKSMFAGYPDADFLITGHSLGGALSQMAALEMKQNPVYNALSIGKVETITFGSPRWCDEGIATLYGEVVDSNWRIVNQRDVIPTAPLIHLGYHHTATMIRYNDAETRNYTQCDGTGEDYTNRDCYYYISSITDHLNYFNLYESCKDDTVDSADAITDDATDVVSAGSPINEVEQLSPVGMWCLIGTGILGWIVAVVIGCCWYRERGKLKKYRILSAKESTTYHMFNQQFE